MRKVDTYKDHESMGNNWCFYCSSMAWGVDNFPPKFLRFSTNLSRLKVRCCHECLLYLHKKLHSSLEERRNDLMRHRKEKFTIGYVRNLNINLTVNIADKEEKSHAK